MMLEKALDSKKFTHKVWPDRLEFLRQRINNEEYLHAAIQRLALVLSKELMDITMKGGINEWKRRKQP
ncbi:MAG: hypothetical protein LBI12_02880 [Treponema sp.]|jgi:flagellar biosynthesis regulator FlaF|nr:hypothetical protein [Treponema sp.]